jgi:hypothetical protein
MYRIYLLILAKFPNIHIPVISVSCLEIFTLTNITEIIKLVGEIIIISISVFKLLKNKKK